MGGAGAEAEAATKGEDWKGYHPGSCVPTGSEVLQHFVGGTALPVRTVRTACTQAAQP